MYHAFGQQNAKDFGSLGGLACYGSFKYGFLGLFLQIIYCLGTQTPAALESGFIR
jgi:hypothetical protein